MLFFPSIHQLSTCYKDNKKIREMNIKSKKRTSKLIPPPRYKTGGGMGASFSLGFCCFTMFRRDFTFGRQQVISSTRWIKYYGLWRCWGLWYHPKRRPRWILLKIENYKKNSRTWKCHIKHDIMKMLIFVGICPLFTGKGWVHAVLLKKCLTTCNSWRQWLS